MKNVKFFQHTNRFLAYTKDERLENHDTNHKNENPCAAYNKGMLSRPLTQALRKPFEQFFALQAASGILLIVATGAALTWANSPWAAGYEQLWHAKLLFGQSLHFWVNDALMAVFFFTVGLEIKRELSGGELSSAKKAALPLMAALGGMMAPAIIYVLLVGYQNPALLKGWGIPTVTDIAFALGVLALLGNRVPVGLRVFLTALAIIDDLGAIFIIALFYSGALQWGWLLCAIAIMGMLALLNRFKRYHPLPLIIFGLALWVAVLKSGLHATLSGVLLATIVPAGPNGGGNQTSETQNADSAAGASERPSPLHQMETGLQPWVSYGVLPLFALANAGVCLPMTHFATAMASPVTLGIVAGLCLGKPLGIGLFSWLSVRLGLAELPDGVSWRHIRGAGMLGGIGFTMSLFITLLAFQNPTGTLTAKLAILVASLLSGLLGSLFLWKATRPI